VLRPRGDLVVDRRQTVAQQDNNICAGPAQAHGFVQDISLQLRTAVCQLVDHRVRKQSHMRAVHFDYLGGQVAGYVAGQHGDVLGQRMRVF
jgi:hypothetical protein